MRGTKGEAQAVNRAELTGYIKACVATTGEGHIWIENVEVVDGFWAGRFAQQQHGPNQDLWAEVADVLTKRDGLLFPVKTKGVHIDDLEDQKKLLRGEILHRDFFGNLWADRVVAMIAEKCQLDPATVQNYKVVAGLAKKGSAATCIG